MPGWHEATKDLQDAGRVRMVGIVQEQHPDRAGLFMQWKQMGWPILVDSYDLLEVPYVPITLTLDEHGIVRNIHQPGKLPEGLEATFLDRTFDAPARLPTPSSRPADLRRLEAAARSGGVDDWRTYGNALAVWGGPSRITEAIRAYEQAVRLAPSDGMTRFRLGVALRMRYDTDDRREGDFQAAVREWSAALAVDPNQYIWRRRIQQYGPRLDKPYPFYDWVVVARQEVEARGETPMGLVVEPGGAEFAQPIKAFADAQDTAEPDPRGRVLRDEGQFVEVETVTVPNAIPPGSSARFHVVFRPIERNKSHWNNEAEELALWVNPPRGWQVEQRYLTAPLPPSAVSQETRKIEVEVYAPERAKAGAVTIPAYALYYVCEDVNGVCMYRRQDIDLSVELEP